MALGVLFSRNSHKSFGDSFESRNFAAWNDLRLSSYPSSCSCLLREWAWINTFAVVSWLLSLSMISRFFSPQAWICPIVSREMAVGNAITSIFTSRFMIRFVRPIPHRLWWKVFRPTGSMPICFLHFSIHLGYWLLLGMIPKQVFRGDRTIIHLISCRHTVWGEHRLCWISVFSVLGSWTFHEFFYCRIGKSGEVQSS